MDVYMAQVGRGGGEYRRFRSA